MQTSSARKRFTESLPGKAAAVLLGIVWVASMGMVDSNPYSAAPWLAGLCLVVLLWVSGVLPGYKTVRLRMVSWLSLAAGAYFLLRCHAGYSVVEAWGESALIAGCFIFYIAGVYAGQGEGSRGITVALGAALAANLAWGLWQFLGQPAPFPLRPAYGVCGETARHVALFTYKNFAGFFLMTAGALPLCNLIFRRERKVGAWLMALFGLVAIAASFQCGTRCVYLLLPAVVLMLWLLWLVAVVTDTRRCSLLFIASGLVLVVSAIIAFYESLFGRALSGLVDQTDMHLRDMAWELVCRFAPNAPLWGFGPRATQWEIVQYFNEWCTPNMAHNEYLQAWMDYGLIGLVLMSGVLLVHFISGFRRLASDHIGENARAKTAMGLLFLIGGTLYAVCDFGWHQPALAGGAAFACGILASPYPRRPWRWSELGRNWAPESRPQPVPVRSQGVFGKVLLLLAAAGLGGDMATVCSRLAPAWLASWQYNRLMQNPGNQFEEKRALLERTFAQYPDSQLTNTYVQLPMATPIDWTGLENMLKATLAANPKQAFIVVILVDVLGRQGKFAEAELLMRRTYAGDGPGSTNTTSWGFYYAYNLIRWGQAEMYKGNYATALSMLRHGFAVASHRSGIPNTAWRSGYKPWERGVTARFREDVKKAAKGDIEMLQLLGVTPDDSWQAPMEVGGKPGLYLRWKPSGGKTPPKK